MYIHIYIENIRSSDCWRDRKTYFEDLAKGNFPLLLLPLLPRERIDGTGARATKLHIYRVYQTTRASQISRKPRTTDKNISDKSCRVSSNVLHSNIGTTLNSVVKVT